MRDATLAILAGTLLLIPPNAAAQEADHSDRGAGADFREHEEEPEPQEFGLDGRARPAWSASLALPVLADSNPFWDREGSQAALLAAPSAAIAYAHPQLLPGWDLELRTAAAADFFSHDADELNEARLDAAARISHELGNAGTLTFGFKARWTYIGKNFGDFDHAQQRYSVAFTPNISDDVWASIRGEYRDASADSEKRFVGTANLDWTMLENDRLRVGFFQEFAYSHFTAGSNDGRQDLLSLSEVLLSPKLDLPEGAQLGVAATLFHRFSNRGESRFTAVQIGPSVRLDF